MFYTAKHIDEDYLLMGFNPKRSHPKYCIMHYLSVCPPVARPAIMASEGSRARGQDDLTHKLQDINKKNLEVKEILCAEGWDMYSGTPPSAEALEKINKLQFEAYTSRIIDSSRSNRLSVPVHRQKCYGPPKRKEGRIRGNLMGNVLISRHGSYHSGCCDGCGPRECRRR